MMKSFMIAAALAALTLPIASEVFARGPIQTACLRSDRPAANRALCSCIQSVANQTLSRSDQNLAARFFSDPDRAQQVRMSRTASDNAFWARYRAFGTTAEQYCR